AGLLMVFTVALALFSGGMILTDLGELDAEARGTLITLSIFCLTIALSFIAATLGVLRGRNAARIASFVMYGIFLAFNGCAGSIVGIYVTADADAPWQAHTFTFLMVALFVVDIVIIILLALGETARWFHAMTAARRAGLI
ncbi:hypothetical protein, partial [Stackebrandtia soli]|uniref:hypothetical protein n=1 Tax=Stackebrandtia soli TaxID=1892856 RepID=UPI0039EC7005